MTDLTLTGRDQRAGAGMKTAVARNRAFAAAGGHDGASLFPALGLLVVTCLDARVDPARILDLDLGEALVIRNNGGRVTPQLINDLAYVSQLAETARPEGPLFEVAVTPSASARTSPHCATTPSSSQRPRSSRTSTGSSAAMRSRLE
jgi:carbonic anhydrase